MAASIAVLARVSPGVLGVGFGPVDLERLAYVAEGIDEFDVASHHPPVLALR
jgi:hypothetical protein